MAEFLKFWLQCFLISWRLGYGVFNYIAGLCFLVSTGLFYYKKRYQHKWKRWEQIIMKLAFCLFVISFLLATFFVAPFLHYRDDVIIPNKVVIPINTKQEIRSLLESVNPDILQRIDTEQHEIPISIGVPTQMRLAEISKLPDFDTYLAFKKTKKTMIGDGSSEGFIKELDENSFRVGYYIYPKDALRK